MGYKLYDYYCKECGHAWEDLAEQQEDGSYPSECSECGTVELPGISAVPLAGFSMMTTEQREKCLEKRSKEHTQKQIIEKTPEKWGALGIARARRGKIRSAGGIPKKGE